MNKDKRIDKISSLAVNLACFGLGVSLTTMSFVGYQMVNDKNPEEYEVVFEDTKELEEEQNLTDFNPTHYEDVIAGESVVLGKSTSGMALSKDFEDYIRSLCDEYASNYDLDADELFQSTLVIGDQESDGEWNCNGKISATNDYGEFQINISNHAAIKKYLGYTTEELLNDQEKNADAAVWIISNIMVDSHCNSTEDIYGMYNGWISWEQKDTSVEYVESCMERKKAYFGEILYLTKR